MNKLALNRYKTLHLTFKKSRWIYAVVISLSLKSVLANPFFGIPPQQPFPLSFGISPLQSPLMIPQGTPLNFLCPPGMPMGSCLSLTSFPAAHMNAQQQINPMMLSLILNQAKPVSQKRVNKLLKKDSDWKSYRYSSSRHRYVRMSKKERDDRDPKGNYLHIHTDEDTVTNKIITDMGGQSHIGTGAAVHTNHINPTGEANQETPVIGLDSPSNALPLLTGCGNNLTESGSYCIECNNQQTLRRWQSTSRTNDLIMSLRKKQKAKSFCQSPSSLKTQNSTKFNSKCNPSTFEAFSTTLSSEACKNNIPPAIMFSIMSAESSGNCQAKGDKGRSIGLFQIHVCSTTISECAAESQECKKNRKNVQPSNTCVSALSNIETNMQESFRILKEKYKITNNRETPNHCNSNNCNPNKEEMDKWRKAIAAYNGGQGRILNIKNKIQKAPKDLEEAWPHMSEWEKMRNYYFSYDSSFDLSNLAHTELILGSHDNQPSLYNTWKKTTSAQCSSQSKMVLIIPYDEPLSF